MSRIIVKNLPKKTTEERVRDLFGTKGLVTDVQLKYTAEGRFRQFCFVGYHSDDEATAAIEHFNNTRINTSKVIVELCASLGDHAKPKSWSKYSISHIAPVPNEDIKIVKDSKQKAEPLDKKKLTHDLLDKYKDDPLFEEFLEIHDKNEAEELKKLKNKKVEIKLTNEEEESTADTPADNEQVSDLEYLQQLKKNSKQRKELKQLQLFTLKLRDLPYNAKKRDIKQFFKPLTPFSIRLPRNIKGIAYVAFKQEKLLNKALLKDKSFLSGRQISVIKYNKAKEHLEQDGAQADVVKRTKWKEQQDSLKNEEEIGESGQIFMRNLSYLTIEDDLEKLFSPFGPIAQVQLPIDNDSRRCKGFGTVTFLMPEHAVRAYGQLDGAVLHGRMLHLLPAKSHHTPADKDTTQQTFKSRKQESLKANATSTHNWNALFLGADAVALIVAERHGASKADVVLNDAAGGSSSAAVRLALAETQLVTETRQYLLGEGVDLAAFTQVGTKRSKTVIIVKNLPAHTEARELKSIFEKFGVIGRIILPPAGISALIEFLEPSEARMAFTNLAYSKFKHLPLYLEFAPENSLTNKQLIQDHVKNNLKNEENKDEDLKEETEEDDDYDEEHTTLFVKNLNFETTDDKLKEHFRRSGKIRYANVATKRQNRGGKVAILSMGYGFVRFCTKGGADNALKTLQHCQLDGKSLEIKRSERTVQQNDVGTPGASKRRQNRSKTKQTGTKILIRNIPFQANLYEVKQLFKVFGDMKAFRLPKKMSGSGSASTQHRGFGFVDYVTKSDAKRAFEALGASTHLYGRRLVLEWATQDIDDDVDGVDPKRAEQLEKLRKRTAEHFTRSQTDGATKKSKKSILTID